MVKISWDWARGGGGGPEHVVKFVSKSCSMIGKEFSVRLIPIKLQKYCPKVSFLFLRFTDVMMAGLVLLQQYFILHIRLIHVDIRDTDTNIMIPTPS